MPPIALRFATDDDCLLVEPSIETIWPRTDARGAFIRSWDQQHLLGMKELERRLRATQDTPQRFELGRLSPRSHEQLRDCAAAFTLHFIYVAAQTSGDPDQFLERKASYYWRRAEALFEAERSSLDYDTDYSGDFGTTEQNQPFPPRMIRG